MSLRVTASLAAGPIVSRKCSLNPVARRLVLLTVGLPNTLRPFKYKSRVLFGVLGRAHIHDGEMPTLAWRLRFLNLNFAIQPSPDGGIDGRISAVLKATAEPGQMSHVGFRGAPVLFRVLHAVGIEGQVACRA